MLINSSMYVDQYPLPKPEKMFAEIAGERNLQNWIWPKLTNRSCWKKNRNLLLW